MVSKQPDGLNWFAYAVGLTVLVVFAAYCVRQLWKGQEIPLPIMGLIGIVAGSLFGRKLAPPVRKRKPPHK